MSTARLGTITGWVFVVLFVLTCFYFGFLSAQTALTDPDTCWLVTLGERIAKAGIPSSDPYSWTLATSGAVAQGQSKYIAYQWLSATIIATIFQLGGATALLYLTALTVCSSFIVVPLIAARTLALPLWPIALGAATALSAGSFHFPCRPEIFSYLLLALLIMALSQISLLNSYFSRVPIYSYTLVGIVLFALWANLHTGFVVGLIVLAVAALTERSKPLLLLLLGALPGTLLTPFGSALWQYLPHLFFSQANKYNVELLPLRAIELFSLEYLSFDLILVAIGLAWLDEIRAWIGSRGLTEKNAQISLSNLSWLILSTFALFMAMQCRRLVPFACLMAMGYLYRFLRQGKDQPQTSGFIQAVEKVPQMLLQRTKNLIILLPLVLTALGVSNACSVFPAALPQDTYALFEPKAALQLIAGGRPKGKLLNDPQFGDLMLLNFKDQAQVFIDTRFDIYGDQLVLDYWKMANARGNWQELLKQYQIDWLFFPPRAPVVHRLLNDPNWQLLHRDNTAVILTRRSGFE